MTEKISREGLIIGIFVGIGVCVPVILFTAGFLTDYIGLLLVGLAVLIVLVSLLAATFYFWRDRIISAVLGDTATSYKSLLDNVSQVIDHYDSDPVKTSKHAKQAFGEASGIWTWIQMRRMMINVIITLSIGTMGLVTTMLLIKQTEAIYRQNEIIAGEGTWELFWKSYNSISDDSRLESVFELLSKAQTETGGQEITLSGVSLSGHTPTSVEGRGEWFVHAQESGFSRPPIFVDEEVWYEDGLNSQTYIPSEIEPKLDISLIREFPVESLARITSGSLDKMRLTFKNYERLDLSDFSFRNSVVSFGKQTAEENTFIRFSTFEDSFLSLDQDYIYMDQVLISNSVVHAGFGRKLITSCRFNNAILKLYWNQHEIYNCTGNILTVNFVDLGHPWTKTREDSVFEQCTILDIFVNVGRNKVADELQITETFLNELKASKLTFTSFLEGTFSETCRIGRIAFLFDHEVGVEESQYVILSDLTEQAFEWNRVRSNPK